MLVPLRDKYFFAQKLSWGLLGHEDLLGSRLLIPEAPSNQRLKETFPCLGKAGSSPHGCETPVLPAVGTLAPCSLTCPVSRQPACHLHCKANAHHAAAAAANADKLPLLPACSHVQNTNAAVCRTSAPPGPQLLGHGCPSQQPAACSQLLQGTELALTCEFTGT